MKLAVVMACHSYPELYPEAIESLLEQRLWPDVVIPVYDVPHADYYTALTHEFVKKTSLRFSEISTGGNQGVSLARNYGFLRAVELNCDWVLPFDEDDLLRLNYIESLQQAIEWCPDIDVWYTDWTEFGDQLGFHRTPEYTFEELAEHPFIPATAGIRVSIWQKVRARTGTGYDEALMRNGLRWEDYLFYLEAGLLNAKMGRFGAGALLRVRRHGRTGTDVANETIPEWRKYAKGKLKEHYDFEVVWQ